MFGLWYPVALAVLVACLATVSAVSDYLSFKRRTASDA